MPSAALFRSAFFGPDDDAVSLHGHDLHGRSRRHELAVGEDREADAVMLRRM